MGFRRLDAKTISPPPPPPPATNSPCTNLRVHLLSPLPAANVRQQQQPPVDLLNQTATTQQQQQQQQQQQPQQQHGLPNSVSVLIIVVPASLILLLFGIFLYIFLQYYNHHHGSSTNNNNNNNKSKDVESIPNNNIISKKLQQDMINVKFQTKQLGGTSGSPCSLHHSTPVDARNMTYNGGMSSSSGSTTDHHQNCTTTLVGGRRSSANSSSLRSVNYYLNYSCSTTSSSSNSNSSSNGKGGGGGQVFTYRSLETATDGFSSGNVIGNGGFGVVYRGVLKDGTVAAVKRLNSQTKHGDRDFRMEVDLLSRLQSPYVVPLLGYCADQNHRILVFEYMTNGSLQDHLYTNTNSSINGCGGSSAQLHHQSAVADGADEQVVLGWDIRLRIALDCAKGLEYLHELVTPSIIHRDFKSSNVLLDRDYRARVSDFGLAKMGSDKLNGLVATRVLGTTGYVAPEYAATGRLTTKSDVYSFGVVLLELITGRVPVNTKRPAGEQALVSWALPRLTNREKVAEMIDPSLQGHYSLKDLIQVAAIAAMCVQPEADYRPLITDVVQSLIPLVKNQTSASNSATPSKLQHHQLKTLRTLSIESGLSSKNSLSNSPRLV